MADDKMDMYLTQMIRFGDTIPDKFYEPDLIPGNEFYLNAFYDLTTTRSIGMGAGPIPYNAILQYGEFHSLTDEELHDLIFFILYMDNAYLKYAQKDTDTTGKKPKPATEGGT